MRTAPGAGKAQPRAPRRAAHFWAPLNDWWRSYLAERGRRPVTTEVQVWYNEHADAVWGDAKPTWKEARIHAKCLRSTEQVKNYFREYRARGKGAIDLKDESRPLRQSNSIKQEEVSTHDKPGAANNLRGIQSGSCPGTVSAAATLSLQNASSSGFLTDPHGFSGAGVGPLPDPVAALALGMNPTTITTGNGLPPAWQQRSVSERFVRYGEAQQPKQELAWDHSHSSVIFRPPSLSLHAKKPQSPFILSHSNKEGDLLNTAGSPVASVLSKAQSFSCSSKRRHTVEDGFTMPAASPLFLQQAAGFPDPSGPCYSNTPIAYGIPLVGQDARNCPDLMEFSHKTSFAEHPYYASGIPRTLRYPVPHTMDAPGSCRQAAGSQQVWDSSGDRCSPAPGAGVLTAPHPEPEHSLAAGSMDQRLVDHIARNAAARSSIIERSVASCSRVAARNAATVYISAGARPLPHASVHLSGSQMAELWAFTDEGPNYMQHNVTTAPHPSSKPPPGRSCPPLGMRPHAMGSDPGLRTMSLPMDAQMPHPHLLASRGYAQAGAQSSRMAGFTGLHHPIQQQMPAHQQQQGDTFKFTPCTDSSSPETSPSDPFPSQPGQVQGHHVHHRMSPGRVHPRLTKQASLPFQSTPEGEPLAEDSLGLPFQALRVHSAALRHPQEQQTWGGHDWDPRQMPERGPMEWEMRNQQQEVLHP